MSHEKENLVQSSISIWLYKTSVHFRFECNVHTNETVVITCIEFCYVQRGSVVLCCASNSTSFTIVNCVMDFCYFLQPQLGMECVIVVYCALIHMYYLPPTRIHSKVKHRTLIIGFVWVDERRVVGTVSLQVRGRQTEVYCQTKFLPVWSSK